MYICIAIMTVFFTASYFGKKKYQKEFDLVRETIKRFKVTLISPEEGNYQNVLDVQTRQRLAATPELLHYESIRQGIHMSDVVIIEVSHEDIQLGHEITLALMEKKPVLVLSTLKDFSRVINSELFFASKYTQKNIEGVIQDFLARVRGMGLARRFNMFLYPHQLEYLETAAKGQGMNVSEYIRRLINLDRRTAGANVTGRET